jgi:hypothetical protein
MPERATGAARSPEREVSRGHSRGASREGLNDGKGETPANPGRHATEVGLVRIPSLRERRKDIHVIGLRLLQEQVKQKKIDEALKECLFPLLMSHSWPGNLRELQNTIERLALVANMCPELSWAQIVSQIWSPFETVADPSGTHSARHLLSGQPKRPRPGLQRAYSPRWRQNLGVNWNESVVPVR